jgi:lipoprotein-anchoring transpeptidase ErfK/SrfK
MMTTRSRLLLLCLTCVLAVAQLIGTTASAAGAEGAPAPTAPTPQPQPEAAPVPAAPVEVRLSDERTLTTWAHPLSIDPIYSRPDTHAHRLNHLHLQTEDGFEEVYLLLVSRKDSLGREWVKLRVPGRPNGRTGWVLRDSLGDFQTTRWLVVINRRDRRLTAYYKGHRRFTAPVGVGKPSSPTPAGHFWIRERFHLTDRNNPYWPYALGTSAYSTLTDWPGGGVVGIHGDFGAPQLIPGAPSHGCVRMHAADIAWLGPRLSPGTPVEIV